MYAVAYRDAHPSQPGSEGIPFAVRAPHSFQVFLAESVVFIGMIFLVDQWYAEDELCTAMHSRPVEVTYPQLGDLGCLQPGVENFINI
jgi:hypothetical protein